MDESLSDTDQRLLREIAWGSIDAAVRRGEAQDPTESHLSPRLIAPGCSFVTLLKSGALRGCIGRLSPIEPLALDVAHNARSAATDDPRFPPVSPDELPALAIELSVLSPRSPIHFDSEADLLSQLRPGEDGLVIRRGSRSATFLPSVWQSLPSPPRFLAQLKTKAGLGERALDHEATAERYAVQKF